jgi:hypothetical protein
MIGKVKLLRCFDSELALLHAWYEIALGDLMLWEKIKFQVAMNWTCTKKSNWLTTQTISGKNHRGVSMLENFCNSHIVVNLLWLVMHLRTSQFMNFMCTRKNVPGSSCWLHVTHSNTSKTWLVTDDWRWEPKHMSSDNKASDYWPGDHAASLLVSWPLTHDSCHCALRNAIPLRS